MTRSYTDVSATVATPWGQSVTRWLTLTMCNLRTKYEISSFNHSKNIEGIQKFKIDPVPRVNFNSMYLPSSITKIGESFQMAVYLFLVRPYLSCYHAQSTCMYQI